MSKAIALSQQAIYHTRARQIEIIRSAIVLSCGMALIFAGQALPF